MPLRRLSRKPSPIYWRNTQRAASFWRSHLDASPFITRAIRFGVYERPLVTPGRDTAFSLPQIPVDSADRPWLQAELKEALFRGTYESIPSLEAHRLHRAGYPISNAFVVHQDGKRRLVVNLSKLDGFFKSQSVKMETLESFALDLKSNDHLFSFDIAKGYHHFRLHPAIRNWFIFRLENKYYRCIALPFGWQLSPAYFIKIMRPFVRYIRHKLRRRVHPYMDDFLIACASQRSLAKAKTQIVALLSHCGLRRKVGKGCWEGSTRLEHLGFIIDTRKMVFGVKESRLVKLSSMASRLMSQARRNRRLVDQTLLRTFTGLAISCTLAMPLARFYTRSMYDSLTNPRGSRCRLTHAAMRDLKEWKQLRTHPTQPLLQRPMHPRTPSLALHSDASGSIGQGGTLGKDLRQGSPGTWEARGLWDPLLRVQPITFKELRAVTDNLRSFERYLKQGQHIKVWEDNQAVVSILNSMTSRSRPLMRELRRLHRLLLRLGITIESQYVPSAVNRFADRLSRLRTLDDWRINPQLLRRHLHSVQPTIDRFADAQTSILPRFNSQFESPGSVATNALSQLWSHEINYWNPPLKLLPLVTTKILKEKASGLLVTPFWPAQPWFNKLRTLATPQIYHASKAFLPPLWARPNLPPPPWKIAVWEI